MAASGAGVAATAASHAAKRHPRCTPVCVRTMRCAEARRGGTDQPLLNLTHAAHSHPRCNRLPARAVRCAQRPGVAEQISLDVYILRWAAAVLRQVRRRAGGGLRAVQWAWLRAAQRAGLCVGAGPAASCNTPNSCRCNTSCALCLSHASVHASLGGQAQHGPASTRGRVGVIAVQVGLMVHLLWQCLHPFPLNWLAQLACPSAHHPHTPIARARTRPHTHTHAPQGA